MRNHLIGLLFIMVLLSACKDDEEPIAEATFFVKVENTFAATDYFASGVFNTPVGETAPGPALPGASYEFSFNAGKGHYLSFATMFVQSNDLFYAPAPEGIALYGNSGAAVTGDITGMIDLWDAGTEVNQEPGVGDNQAPRQSGANTGADENGTVELITNVNDGYTYPANADVIKVSIAHDGGTMFTVTIQNVSDLGSFQTPFAPGAFVVHAGGTPLFVAGEADAGNGLEGVAEDGNAGPLGDYLTAKSGYFSPYAPGVFAVHSQGANPIFVAGAADLGEGLEALAEDGDPSGLNTAIGAKSDVSVNGAFNTPLGSGAPGPLLPGNSYEFTITAKDGDYLNLATMLVQTNDLFYAFEAGGLALFNDGVPISGDMTSKLSLWDAGTEVNEYPGAGNNQPVRQTGPNTGAAENGKVVKVSDGFTYPATADAIKVTITKQ